MLSVDMRRGRPFLRPGGEPPPGARLLQPVGDRLMNARSLDFVATACGGELSNGSPATRIRRVSTDSRTVQPGDLFIALAGEKFDAHDYLADVAGKGATAVVIA